MEESNDSFGEGCLPIVLIFAFLFVAPYFIFKKSNQVKVIESTTKLDYEIKLRIVNNKVDTLYIYKKK